MGALTYRRRPAATSHVLRAAAFGVLEDLEIRWLFAPLTWSPGPALPSARDHAAALSVGGGSIYVLGGNTSSVLTRFGAGPWGQASAALDVSRVSPGAGVSAGKIIVFGGRGSEVLDGGYRYEPYNGDSQDTAQMPSPRWQMASGGDDSGVYSIGGLDDGNAVLGSVLRYNVANNSWTPVHSLPAARYSSTAVADGEGSLFVFGGASANTASSVTATAYRYDEASDTWNTLATMPLAVRDATAALASNGRIYVIGGATTTGATSTVQSYDPTTNTWAVEPALPVAIRGAMAAPDSDGRIEVIGGVNSAGQSLASVYVTQRLDQPDVPPTFTSTPVTKASADKPYAYQATASGNPLATFALVQAPAGMTINAGTGLLSWQPTAGQVGTQPVVVRATNFAGSADQSFSINVVLETVPPTAPANPRVTGVTSSTVSLAWDASTDNVGVTGYRVYERRRTGFKATHITYVLVGSATESSLTLTGLSAGSSHVYVVAAIDASGNQSLFSPAVSAVTYRVPVLSILGTPQATAKHPMTFTLYASANPKATFALVSGPAGMTVDPDTGLVKWVPDVTDVGTVPATFRATNVAGSGDLTTTITVYPDVPRLTYTLTAAQANQPMTISLTDSSLTTSTFSILSGPAGMTVDPVTGVATWTPTPDDAGQQSVTFAATNSAGTTNLTVPVYVYFTAAPTGLAATNLTGTSATISWTPPADVSHVAGYRVTLSNRVRSGRAYTTHTLTWTTTTPVTSLDVTGLIQGVTYTPRVTALDVAGHTGVTATGTSFVSRAVVTPPPPPPPPPPAPPPLPLETGGTSSSPTAGLFSVVPVVRPVLKRLGAR